MTEPTIITPSHTTQETPQKQANTAKARAMKVWRHALATSVWFYLLVKLFVFDVDVYLVANYAPDFEWILRYKFFLIVGTLGLIAFAFKRRQIILWTLYVAFYPFIIFGWFIFAIILKAKSWTFTFALINGFISAILNLRINLILAAIFFVFSLAIYLSANQYILIVASLGLGIFVIAIYIRRTRTVFKSDPISAIYVKLISFINNYVQSHHKPDAELIELPLRAVQP